MLVNVNQMASALLSRNSQSGENGRKKEGKITKIDNEHACHVNQMAPALLSRISEKKTYKNSKV